MGLGAWLKSLFVQSSWLHLHQEPASTTGDLIDLIDRCVDGRLRYSMEWDDFISWEQANLHVENARQVIGMHETWLFSGSQAQRNAYWYRVVEERNRLAAILGRSQRQLPALSVEEQRIIDSAAS